jgi:hypothetical protein
MRFSPPWGIWIFEDSAEALRMDLRLQCQGYTTALGEELDSYHLNFKDIYP